MVFALRRGDVGFGIMAGWSSQPEGGACGKRTHSRDFAPSPRSVEYSVIRRRGSSYYDGGQKNDLRPLWSDPAWLVRPSRAARAGPVERSVPGLPAARYPASLLSPLRHREARRPRLARGQPAVYPALRPRIASRNFVTGCLTRGVTGDQISRTERIMSAETLARMDCRDSRE